MGSQLLIIIIIAYDLKPTKSYLITWLELVVRYARLIIYNDFYVRSHWRHLLSVLNYFACPAVIHNQYSIVSIEILLWRRHLTFGALRSILVRCKHHVMWPATYACRAFRLSWVTNTIIYFGVKHALGTRLLQKCLRHSPPGVVCTQVWNLKELTEGHHKNAWSMWLNLTQRGKSYRVRTHWGLTGNICVMNYS